MDIVEKCKTQFREQNVEEAKKYRYKLESLPFNEQGKTAIEEKLQQYLNQYQQKGIPMPGVETDEGQVALKNIVIGAIGL